MDADRLTPLSIAQMGDEAALVELLKRALSLHASDMFILPGAPVTASVQSPASSRRAATAAASASKSSAASNRASSAVCGSPASSTGRAHGCCALSRNSLSAARRRSQAACVSVRGVDSGTIWMVCMMGQPSYLQG